MSYQTLLAHLLREDTADGVLDVATTLARRHGAHLIGLHSIQSIEAWGYYDMAFSASLAASWAKTRRDAGERLKALFDKATDGDDFVADWQMPDDIALGEEHLVAEIGNTTDLVILGQYEEPGHRAGRGSLTARVLERCARPVMVVPKVRDGTTVGERCFVAWDGKRASTRALFGALPMLRRADVVRVQGVNTPADERRGMLGLTEQLATTLARHGVAVEVAKSDARAGEIGEELLGAARDWGADTFVAGAYEQAAYRDFLFGSTTRYLLENARMPLVMCT